MKATYAVSVLVAYLLPLIVVSTACGSIKRPALSCADLFASGVTGSGMYWLQRPQASPKQEFCDASWQLLAKFSSGVHAAPSLAAAWAAGQLNAADGTLARRPHERSTKQYISEYANNWNQNGFNVDEVEIRFYGTPDGNPLRAVRFDGKSTTRTTWLSASKVTASSWVDLPADSTPVEKIALQDPSIPARQFIALSAGGGMLRSLMLSASAQKLILQVVASILAGLMSSAHRVHAVGRPSTPVTR